MSEPSHVTLAARSSLSPIHARMVDNDRRAQTQVEFPLLSLRARWRLIGGAGQCPALYWCRLGDSIEGRDFAYLL